MKSQLFIPDKIKVGFQNRSDTYTKRLSYVIYFDNKGNLRKEKSWESWRDKKIEPEEYENKPTEGFVINKNVGGARNSYGWNARNEYVRVFDPRGFEFEISVANLLFILQESNSIKGKGLDGEFVYCWDGSNLVLLPVNCEEYRQCTQFTKLQDEKVSSKDLVPGCSYLTKKQETLIYMGRFMWYTSKYDYRSSKYTRSGKKSYIFLKGNDFIALSGIESLATRITTDPVADYADQMTKLQKRKEMSVPVRLVAQPMNMAQKLRSGNHRYFQTGFREKTPGCFQQCQVCPDKGDVFSVEPRADVTFDPQTRAIIKTQDRYYSTYYGGRGTSLTLEQIESENFLDVFVELESGEKIPYNDFS